MRIPQWALCGMLLSLAAPAAAQGTLRQELAGYVVTLRLPPGGLVAGVEAPIEFRLEDMREAAAVRYARVRGVIDMPGMPSMAKFDEVAHAEGVVGDYGVHPTFPHGGVFRLTLILLPPNLQPATMSPPSTTSFSMEFLLNVADASERRASGAAPAKRYDLQVRPLATPGEGTATTLEIAIVEHGVPRMLPDGRYLIGDAVVRDFDVVHERLLHVFLVRDDLGVFIHEHPRAVAFGVFRLEVTFPTAGRYRVFADVAPRNAGSQILMDEIVVGGTPPPRFDLARAAAAHGSVTSAADGVRVDWQWPDPLPAQETVLLTASVHTLTGSPVADLEPYLGAMGHLMLVHEDGVTFVHCHPDDREALVPGAATVRFLARFPKSGRYRGWAQFQRAGQVLTVEMIAIVP